jgi:hypothetical protein
MAAIALIFHALFEMPVTLTAKQLFQGSRASRMMMIIFHIAARDLVSNEK